MLHPPIQPLLGELGELIDRWEKVQRESEPFFDDLISNLERLDILRHSENDLGLLSIFTNAREYMIQDHLDSIEMDIKVLLKAIDIWSDICHQINSIFLRTSELYNRFAISNEAAVYIISPIHYFLELVTIASKSFTMEYLEKKAILQKLKYESSEHANFSYNQWTSEIYVFKSRVRELLDIVELSEDID